MKDPKKPSGFMLEVDDAPPPDKIGGGRAPAKGADEAPADGDESDGDMDHAMAVDAIHRLGSAFGVEVKDEDAAIKAVYDLMKCSPSGE